MELFETSWMNDFKYYERYYNTDLKKSFSREIPSHYEYFEEIHDGLYENIRNDGRRYKRMLGRSKDTKDKDGVTKPIYLNIREKYWRKSGFNPHPRIAYLDIETRATGKPDPANAPEQITLIQWLDSTTNVEFVLGLREWTPEPDYKLETNVKYMCFASEVDMLDAFLRIFAKLDPLIIYAWNGEGFDFPYLYNRIKNLGLDVNRLSNYGNVKMDIQEYIPGKPIYKLNSDGHHFYDLMEVYKNFNHDPVTSFSLDNIAKKEVHDQKVVHDEFPTFDSFYTGDAYIFRDEPYEDRIREEIRQLQIKRRELRNNGLQDSDEYNEVQKKLMKDINFQFVYYGIQDSVLLKKIDEKMSLTKMVVNISDSMGVLVSDALGTVKPWSQYIANVAYYEHKIMPKLEQYDPSPYVGGFVRDPIKGKHNWVTNFDYNSMYPQLSIAGFNISPETYVPKAKLPPELRELVLMYFNDQDEEKRLKLDRSVIEKITPLLQKYNLALAVNGACYKRELGILPRLVNEIYDNRKKDKKMKFKYEQKIVAINKILAQRGIKVEN
jgi:DNA polymerase elongation subunit (family B)